MLIVFLTGASSAAVRPLLMVFLQDRFTTDVGMLALAFIPAALAYSFLPSRLGRVGDRVGRKPMMILSLLAGGMVSLLIPGVPGLGILPSYGRWRRFAFRPPCQRKELWWPISPDGIYVERPMVSIPWPPAWEPPPDHS